MFTTSQVARMKILAPALFGVAILSTALTSTATPALALGECGPNAHRGPWGGCRFGARTKLGACDTRAMWPLLVPAGRGGA